MEKKGKGKRKFVCLFFTDIYERKHVRSVPQISRESLWVLFKRDYVVVSVHVHFLVYIEFAHAFTCPRSKLHDQTL